MRFYFPLTRPLAFTPPREWWEPSYRFSFSSCETKLPVKTQSESICETQGSFCLHTAASRFLALWENRASPWIGAAYGWERREALITRTACVARQRFVVTRLSLFHDAFHVLYRVNRCPDLPLSAVVSNFWECILAIFAESSRKTPFLIPLTRFSGISYHSTYKIYLPSSRGVKIRFEPKPWEISYL